MLERPKIRGRRIAIAVAAIVCLALAFYVYQRQKQEEARQDRLKREKTLETLRLVEEANRASGKP